MPVPGRRWPVLAMVPVNVLLVLWVWIGRVVFGVFGWFGLIMIPVALGVAVALTISTVLALTQAARPRVLTRGQLVAQLATWVGLLGVGAFLPDFGDAPDSYVSLLTNVFGYSDDLMSLSWLVTTAFAVLTGVAYVALLVTLVVGRRAQARAARDGVQAQATNTQNGWPAGSAST